HAEKLRAAGYAREFRDDVTEIARDQAKHEEERDAQAVFFADEFAQSLSGDHAHARGDLLRKGQQDGDRNHRPQQAISKLRSGGSVGVDAASVVIDVGGDESRPEDREQKEQASERIAK